MSLSEECLGLPRRAFSAFSVTNQENSSADSDLFVLFGLLTQHSLLSTVFMAERVGIRSRGSLGRPASTEGASPLVSSP